MQAMSLTPAPTDGLGLLDCVTRFASYEKNTLQVRRNACQVPPILSAIGEVRGYEIDMGVKLTQGRNRELLMVMEG